MNKNIAILLATYNGERFLTEQIDSIIKQSFANWILIVRDDCSTDNTPKIIKDYSSKYSGKIRILDNQGVSLKAKGNFMELLYSVKSDEFDYIAFCDQDDIWLPNKLSAAINCLEKNDEPGKPALYCGSYQMVNSNLEEIPTLRFNPNTTFGSALIDNIATGCTMVFNRALLNIIQCKKPDFFIMHDDWVYKVCLAVGGKVYTDDKPCILYRQHGNNVLGGLGDSFSKKWSTRLKKLFKSEPIRSKIVESLYKSYNDYIVGENRELLINLLNYKKGFNRFKILFDKRYKGQSVIGDIRFRFLILTGKF